MWVYSLDGRTFTLLGTPYPLSWGNYRGDRIGIFSYNDKAEKGWLDIDWFHYNQIKPANLVILNSWARKSVGFTGTSAVGSGPFLPSWLERQNPEQWPR